MSQPPWEEIEHTADVALRIRGTTLADLFANAARGMLSLVLAGDSAQLETTQSQQVTLRAIDPETLLVDWLSEIVYLIEAHTLIVTGVDELAIENIDNLELTATISGTTNIDIEDVEILHHIKAVTYHDLAIEQDAEQGGYQATVVFDV